MDVLAQLEWEARQQPSPPPRLNEPWELVLARQQELRRNWLPPRAPRSYRRRADGRFAATDDERNRT